MTSGGNTMSTDHCSTETLRLAHHFLLSLRRRAEKTKSHEFASHTPRHFVEVYLQLLNGIESELRDIEESMCAPEVSHQPGYLEKRTKWITIALRKMAPMIRYADMAQLEDSPWGIVGRLQKFCDLLSPEQVLRVILRPRWRYRYDHTLLNEELRRIVKDLHLDDVLSDAPQFVALSFPTSEKNNMLLSAVWAHELGHVLSAVYGKQGSTLGHQFAQRLLTPDEGKIEKLTDLWCQTDDIGALILAASPTSRAEHRQAINQELKQQLSNWLSHWTEELVSDLFAINLFGPASTFAFHEICLRTQDLDTVTPRYPSPRQRLRIQIDELSNLGYLDPPAMIDSSSKERQLALELHKDVAAALEGLKAIAHSPPQQTPDRPAERFQAELVSELLDAAAEQISQEISELHLPAFYSAASMWRHIPKLVRLLDQHIPPNVPERPVGQEPPWDLPDILNAGWFHWLKQVPPCKDLGMATASSANFDERRRTNQLVLKAIEASEFQFQYCSKFPVSQITQQELKQQTAGTPRPHAAVLARNEIIQRLDSKSPNRLVVTPLLDRHHQIQPTGIDVRLGSAFIRPNRPRFTAIDPVQEILRDQSTDHFHEYIYVPLGQKFVIHPGQTVLGCTLEYIAMPNDLMAQIVGRSSWGRLGLIITTAPTLIPGSKNAPTLELVNDGTAPIALYPGLRIGHLMLYTLTSEVQYQGRYDFAIGPQHSKLVQDPELVFLGKSDFD